MSDDFDFSTGLPSGEMAQFLQLYLDETAEQLDALVESLLVLESQPTDGPQLNEAFRLIHSIKGSSAMMGLDAITVLTHHLENHFERLRSGLGTLDAPSMELILRCIDFLRECNRRLRSGSPLGSAPELLEELNTLSTAQPPADLGNPGLSPSLPAEAELGLSAPTEPEPAAPPMHSGAASASAASTAVPRASSPPRVDSAYLRNYRVALRFEPNLALADLKAELVLLRLAEIGTVRDTLPRQSELATIADLRSIQILISSDHLVSDLRSAADVDGVEAIEIDEGATAFAKPDSAAADCAVESSVESDAATPADVPVIAGEIATVEAAPIPDADSDTVSAAPSEGSSLAAEAARAVATDEGKSKVVETVRVDIDRLDKLMNLTGELVVNKARFVQIARQMRPAFRKSSGSGRARAFSESMRRAIQLMKAHVGEREGAVDAEWHERFHDLESEIDALEEESRLWEQGRRCFSQITEAIDQMSRVSDSLQRGVLDTRMVPVAPLFNRFKRVVRDIALELDKKVNLEIRGEKTELDKRMIDELGDPLVHLVRNAIDHGIEPAEERLRRGKPAVGTIRLEAAHSGNNVFISIHDDGGGIPVEKIRQRIVTRGLLSTVAADGLTEREVIEYIWHPGFSTAERVSDISGRGVGMDIVKTRIAELNGAIDVQQAAGVGTTFTIRLPLTLAIIRSLLFQLRHGMFAVPIDTVREIVSVPLDQIVTIHGRKTFEVRGEFIPLVDIDDVFTWHSVEYRNPAGGRTASESETQRVNVVILHSNDRTMGLKVDELHGSQDIVIKSLAENFISIRGLSGASILGDGSVCLLLDVGAVIGMTMDIRRDAPQP